jgi:hypothetical protein
MEREAHVRAPVVESVNGTFVIEQDDAVPFDRDDLRAFDRDLVAERRLDVPPFGHVCHLPSATVRDVLLGAHRAGDRRGA